MTTNTTPSPTLLQRHLVVIDGIVVGITDDLGQAVALRDRVGGDLHFGYLVERENRIVGKAYWTLSGWRACERDADELEVLMALVEGLVANLNRQHLGEVA